LCGEPRTIDVSKAPPLEVRTLGDMVRGRTFFCQQNWGVVVAASSKGDGWSAYMLYSDHIVVRDPWTIIEVNLQTEEITRHDGQMCDCWFPTLMPDGCIYVFPEDAKSDPKAAYVARLDPKKGKLEIFGPGSPDSFNRCVSWGPGEYMYIGGYRLQHAMRFDPKTGEFVDYGPQGPGPEVVGEGIYHIAADENYVYTTMGGKPYYLYSCHRKTRRQKLLLKLDWPQRAVLVRRPEGVFVIIDIQRDTPRLTEPTGEIVRYYRLENNELTPVDGLPAQADAGPEKSPGGIVKPQVHPKSPACRPDGTATLWYRPHEGEWKSVTFDVGGGAGCLYRLGTFEGKVIGSSEDPYSLFMYDPATGKKTVLGRVQLHVYAFQEFGGKVYCVGYSGAPVYEWDPRKPWSWRPPRPEGVPAETPALEPNPRCVAKFERQRRSYDIVLAADGRMYVPCSANIESLPGGLLGWYDPAGGESGGIREGFEGHSGCAACLAMDGRYVVVVTRPWPRPQKDDPHAYVLTYDAVKRKVVGRLRPIEGNVEPGVIVEWRPAKIVGRIVQWPPDEKEHKWAPEKAVTSFYLMDVEKQTVERTVTVARSAGHNTRMIRLPNGKLACLFYDVVVLVDPADWSFEVIGKLDVVPRDWIMLGDDLYLILDTQLACIRDFGRSR